MFRKQSAQKSKVKTFFFLPTPSIFKYLSYKIRKNRAEQTALMEKEHMRQLDCDQLSIKSAARNKKQTCINKNILTQLNWSGSWKEDAWTCTPWNKIASPLTLSISKTRYRLQRLDPAPVILSPRSQWCPHITVVHRLIPGSSATSRHGPPRLIRMQKIFPSPS